VYVHVGVAGQPVELPGYKRTACVHTHTCTPACITARTLAHAPGEAGRAYTHAHVHVHTHMPSAHAQEAERTSAESHTHARTRIHIHTHPHTAHTRVSAPHVRQRAAHLHAIPVCVQEVERVRSALAGHTAMAVGPLHSSLDALSQQPATHSSQGASPWAEVGASSAGGGLGVVGNAGARASLYEARQSLREVRHGCACAKTRTCALFCL